MKNDHVELSSVVYRYQVGAGGLFRSKLRNPDCWQLSYLQLVPRSFWESIFSPWPRKEHKGWPVGSVCGSGQEVGNVISAPTHWLSTK